MKEDFLVWVGGLLAAYFLLNSNENADTSSPTNESFFAPPLEPLEIRNDPMGLGHFGAPRGARLHQGLDLTSIHKYQAVRSPITGRVIRRAYPYADDLRWEGCEIIGTGAYEGYAVKLFYMSPTVVPMAVVAGQRIGQMQQISEKWGDAMLDHLHVEVRKNGELLDPEPFFFGGVQA